MQKIQSYPLFYQQLIGFWEKVGRKEPLNALEIVNQVIWNNSFLLKQGNSMFYPSLYNKGILKVNDLQDDFGNFMKWASAKLKFDLEEQDAMLWLSVLESIPSQWKRKVKSHDMKIVDDVSAGPSLNMTVKSVYNILLRSVKTCPTSQKSIETLLNNYSINWPEVYMIHHKVTIETSLRVFQYKLLNNIIYLNKRIAKFDSAVNPLCSLCSQFPEDVVHLFCHCQKAQQLWELCRYHFDRLPSPPGTPGLLHRNVCPAPGLLHNRKCPGAGPINDDVPGAGHLHQLAFKHENC